MDTDDVVDRSSTIDRPIALTDSTGWLLNKAAQDVLRRFEAALGPTKIRARHYGVLAVVGSSEPLSQQRIGDLLDVDRTTMVGVIDELEARGLLVRTRNPTDRRGYLISLTEQGTALLRGALVQISDEVDEKFLASLHKNDRERLNRLLIEFVSHNRDQSDPSTPQRSQQ